MQHRPPTGKTPGILCTTVDFIREVDAVCLLHADEKISCRERDHFCGELGLDDKNALKHAVIFGHEDRMLLGS